MSDYFEPPASASQAEPTCGATGHLFTVLAYQLVQVIRTRRWGAGQLDDAARAPGGQQRVTAVFRREDGCTLHVRKSTQAEASQQAIYDALGVRHRPAGSEDQADRE